MKRSTTILLCSIAPNPILGVLAWPQSAPRTVASVPSSTPATAISDAALLAALKSGDAATLRAAGLPDEVHRHLRLGAALDRLEARLMAIKPGSPPDPRYWRNAAYYRRPFTLAQRQERNAARLEFADAVRELTGDELTSDPAGNPAHAALPPDKRRALARIEQDYEEMVGDVVAEAGSLQLPSDREKLRYLDEQKQRDIAAALSPEERDLLDMTGTPTALLLRARFGDLIENEAQYRTLYAILKAHDDKYPAYDPRRGMPSPENWIERREAEPSVSEQIRAAIGDAKYGELLRAMDQDRRTLRSLEERAALPAGTAERALSVRDALAIESQRIASDPTRPTEQRQAELRQLADRARQELVGVLGSEAGPAYVKYATWIRHLSDGNGFTVDPKAEPKDINVFGFGSVPVSVKSE